MSFCRVVFVLRLFPIGVSRFSDLYFPDLYYFDLNFSNSIFRCVFPALYFPICIPRIVFSNVHFPELIFSLCIFQSVFSELCVPMCILCWAFPNLNTFACFIVLDSFSSNIACIVVSTLARNYMHLFVCVRSALPA